METVTIRELHDRGGEVIDRSGAGGHMTLTRDRRPVAERRPLRAKGITGATLLERWHRPPTVGATGLRRDVDSVIEPGL